MGVFGRGLGMGKVIIRLCLHGCIRLCLLVLAPSEPEGVPVESVGPPVRWGSERSGGDARGLTGMV